MHESTNIGGRARPSTAPQLNTQLVGEILDHIIAHNGPDKEGRGHPTRKTLPYGELSEALRVAQANGIPQELRAFHFPRTTGVWQTEGEVDQVLKRRIDQLLEQKFDGNLAKLCAEITSKDLLSPFTEVIAGRDLLIKMNMVGQLFRNSPYQMVSRYIELVDRVEEFSGFRPHHLAQASSGTFKDREVIDEVLRKKIDQLLTQKFEGNLAKLCAEITSKDLLSPFTEAIAGREFSVSMAMVGALFGSSRYRMVSHYIELADRVEEFSGLRPYHLAQASRGSSKDPELIDEVLEKKINQLLEHKFNGNLAKLCAEVTNNDLLSPFTELVAGQDFSVNMAMVGKLFRKSPYQMVSRYIELVGRVEEFSGFRPYHLAQASSGTFKDREVIDEVLRKKIDQLLEQTFNGDLSKLCAEITKDDLVSPLTEVIAGREFSVNVATVGQMFRNSPYQMVSRYIELVDRVEDFSELRPYHLAQASSGTFKDREVIDEVLRKKIDQLLAQKFEGNLAKLCAEITIEDLLSPFTEVIAGREFSVSMAMVGKQFRSSPYQIVSRYIDLSDKTDEFSGLRPYHLGKTCLGTYEDPEVVDEVLRKKIDHLLDQKFDGSLAQLCAEVDQKDLLSPFTEAIAGREFSVKMGRVGQLFRDSPYQMVSRYLEFSDKTGGFRGLRPYHLEKAPINTFRDPEVVDEVLRKKIDQLLEHKFNGNLAKLCAEVTKDDLLSPFTELVAGRDFSVKMSMVGHHFRGSPYSILRRYHLLVGRSFPYSKACFAGPPDTRARRMSGELAGSDLKKIQKPDGTYDTSAYGFKRFASPDKAVVRELLIETALTELGDRSISYLGLETEQFESLRAVYSGLNLAPGSSLIAERSRRTFQAMQAVRNALRGREKKALSRVQIQNKAVEKVLQTHEGEFNLANLDFVGHLSEGKEYTLQLLFERKLLQDDGSLVFVTLDDSELARSRAKRAGYGKEQAPAMQGIVTRCAQLTGYEATQLFSLPYAGGTKERAGRPMLCLGYSVRDSESDRSLAS